MRRYWLQALLLLTLCACRIEPSARQREIFDEHTGNTITVVSKPIVFSRERNDVAAYARDYATLVAIEVDHSGASDDYLLLYRWSTVDRRMSPPPAQEAGEIRILSDGRELTLVPLADMPVSVGSSGDLHVPRHAAAVRRAFAVDLDTLHFIAASTALSLQMPQEALSMPFQLWVDGRVALSQFVHGTSPAIPSSAK